jgi:hypothetical protein
MTGIRVRPDDYHLISIEKRCEIIDPAGGLRGRE